MRVIGFFHVSSTSSPSFPAIKTCYWKAAAAGGAVVNQPVTVIDAVM